MASGRAVGLNELPAKLLKLLLDDDTGLCNFHNIIVDT